MKIAIVGTHGSGKTVLTFDLFSHLKKIGKCVNIMPEVARSSPYLAAGERSPESQLHLFASQIECELRHQRGYDILLTDRSILDILMYTELFFSDCQHLQSMRDFSKHYISTYDFMFRTSTMYDPTIIEDRIRPRSRELQLEAHRNLTRVLEEFYPGYVKLPENNTNPLDFVMEKIKNFM